MGQLDLKQTCGGSGSSRISVRIYLITVVGIGQLQLDARGTAQLGRLVTVDAVAGALVHFSHDDTLQEQHFSLKL